MVPFFLFANGFLLLLSGVYGVFQNVDFGIFTGLLVGNIAAVVNFYLIGYTAGIAIRRKDPRKARRLCSFSYGMRILVIFGVFGLLITLKLINPVVAVIPLLFPSFHYKLKAVLNKTV